MNGTLSGKTTQIVCTLMTSQLATLFITLELAIVTLEWAFAAVGKIMSGQVATLNTAVPALVTLVCAFITVGSIAVLAVVTLVWAFATVGKSQFESLTLKKQVTVTENEFRNNAI